MNVGKGAESMAQLLGDKVILTFVYCGDYGGYESLVIRLLQYETGARFWFDQLSRARREGE